MEKILLIFAVVLILSVFSTKISEKFNIPLLIVFIFIGMVMGSEGLGNIYFDNHTFAYFVATVALSFILFTGGLQTDYKQILPILKEGIGLSVIGVFLNAVIFAIPIYYLTNFTVLESLLASATVASTDAAAVFSILGFSKIKLKSNVKNLLEFESGSNDPMAYVLVIIFITMITAETGHGILYYIIFFILQMAIGAGMGFAIGHLTKFIMEKAQMPIEELYAILVVGILFFTFSATNILHGNGFLAIYILGMMIRSKKFLYKNSTIKFFSVYSWFMQITLFICLGLLVFPSRLFMFAGWGIILAVILIFAVRPAVVFLTFYIIKSKNFDFKSKIFLSWGGLKGAVPIVFAIYTMVNLVPQSNEIFNLIFFIVLVSVLIQGSTLVPLAKKLNLVKIGGEHISDKSDTENLDYFEDQLLELSISSESHFAGKKISEVKLPENSLITLIKRDKKHIHPNGKTVIVPNDRLVIMSPNKVEFFEYIESLTNNVS